MKKILITGAHSFIGNAVAARLADFPERYRCTLVSVRDNALSEIDFSEYDCVLHAAGIAHISPDPSLAPEYFRVNRDLALECAARAKAAGAAQFIYLSSMIVYGRAGRAGQRHTITQATPPAPENAYGQSKLEAEQGLFRMEAPGFRVAALRPPMVYGAGCRGNYNALRSYAGKLSFFPDFSCVRSVIYVENLSELIRCIIDRNDRGIFCPQNEKSVSTGEIVREIARAHGRSMRLTPLFNPALLLLGGFGTVRRAFGDMAYAPEMSIYPENYRLYDFAASIRRTEALWEEKTHV